MGAWEKHRAVIARSDEIDEGDAAISVMWAHRKKSSIGVLEYRRKGAIVIEGNQRLMRDDPESIDT